MDSSNPLREAVFLLFYHDGRSSVGMVRDYFGEYPAKVPPVPTEEQRQIALAIVERLLWVRYDNLIFEGDFGVLPHFNGGLLDEFYDPNLSL